MEDLKGLFAVCHVIAKANGMGFYFNNIKFEIENNAIHNDLVAQEKQEDAMKEILTRHLHFKYILVNCQSGIERRYIHNFAKIHGFLSSTVKTTMFNPVEIFSCNSCCKRYYLNELSCCSDWSTISDISYGTVLKCPCGESYISSDGDSEGLKRGNTFNAILLGRIFEELTSKQLVKKNRKICNVPSSMVKRHIIGLDVLPVEFKK